MKIPCMPLSLVVVVLAAAAAPVVVLAQASAPASLSGASAPPAPKPALRPMTPVEKSRTAAPELRPERPVVPQLNIPLGKKSQPSQSSEPTAPRSRSAASSAVIGDAAARCEAELSERVRATCRDRLAHEAKRQ